MPRITFHLDCPLAQNVFIAGNFNQWNPNDVPLKKRKKGHWSITLTLPPGRYEYRYIVDGFWMNDPKAEKVPNEWGSENSVIIVE